MQIAQPSCATHDGSVCSGVWHLTHTDWLASSVDTVARHGAKIILIIVVAMLTRFLLRRVIRRATRATLSGRVPIVLRPLRDRATERLVEAGLLSERRRQRAESVGSILSSISSFVIFLVAFILVLGELGLNLAPILATTSIAGVALGFGAQSLVKDFLAGIFLIFEDQFGVGDAIDVGVVSGTVESVGLRTTRLRDIRGVVWYVRNGEVLRVGNLSQGFSRLVLDIPVGYAADTDQAGAVLLGVASQLRTEPPWSESFLADPEVLGVQQFAANAVLLRITIRTPLDRSAPLGRELRARVKKAFEQAGVPLAVVAGEP